MQQIAIAWQSFFEQFTPYVYTDGQFIDDPTNILFPRITYSYSISDTFQNTLTTFQVWDWSFNDSRIWEICNKIAEAVPVEVGTEIIISGETYFEYLNPTTGVWTRFEVGDFQAIADQFAPAPIEWRKVERESAGGINIKRGSPFLTPRISDDVMLRIMYGTMTARYINII